MPDYPLGKWGYSPGARNLRGAPSGQVCMWCVVTCTCTCTGNHKYNYRSMHVPPCCRPAWSYLIAKIVIMNRTSKKKKAVILNPALRSDMRVDNMCLQDAAMQDIQPHKRNSK